MRRFLVEPENVHGSTISIDNPREVHHIRDVLRLGVGAPIVCFDGQGTEYAGVISETAVGRVGVRINERWPEAEPRREGVWLLSALLKGDRFEWLAQKATELGVARLSPMITRHTVVRVGTDQGRRKQERWQRIAREAAKQCGRATVPVVDPPRRFEDVLPLMASAGPVLIPTLVVTSMPLKEVLRVWDERTPGRRAPVAVMIGPEGDFDREEVALAEAHGARPVSLGPRTLRAETASLAVLAILQYVQDEL